MIAPSPRRVLVPGETMLLFVGEPGRHLELVDTFRVSIAGAETNVAIGLARLGHHACWLGRIGADSLGESVLRRLRADGIELGLVVRDGRAPTGVLIRDAQPGRDIHVGYYRTGLAASRWGPSEIDERVLDGVDLVHLTGITPMLSDPCAAATDRLVELAGAAGVPVSIDPNIRLRIGDVPRWRTTVGPLLARATMVFAGSDELELLDVTTDGLLDAGVQSVVVKNSDKSATTHTADGQWHQPAFTVPVADTVGAGDAFAAGYLSGVLEGEPVPVCLERAARVASMAVQTVGDNEGLPGRAELLAAMAAPANTGVVHR